VSQISPPIRILLVVAVAFMGVYMLFMRPKEEVIPPAEPAPNTQTSEPAVSEPGKVAEAAQGAVDAANKQLEQQEAVDGTDAGEAATAGTQAKTQSKAAAKNAEVAAALQGVDLKGLPKPIAKAIRKQKTLVLLFWNGKSADDKAVHKALTNVDRWDGRVYVGSASIKKISKYGPIARGVDVEQSPTVVVVDTELHAETLVGFVDAKTIDQAVVDAFRNTTGLYLTAYERSIDKICTSSGSTMWSVPDPNNGRQFRTLVTKYNAEIARFTAAFAAVTPPKRFRSFHRASLADTRAWGAVWRDMGAYLGAHPTTSKAVLAIDRFAPRHNTIVRRANKRFDDAHLFSCGSQF
jgi:protein-tyrosine-phosphatase